MDAAELHSHICRSRSGGTETAQYDSCGSADSDYTRVADVASTVGKTPQAWNGSIFSMIKSLSENVVVPIAGIILTFVMCLELIQLLIDRNNMHDDVC